MDLFKECIPGIIKKKNYLLTEDNESEYNPFVVNLALSQHIDCIFYVNDMNLYPNLDKKLQYDYFYHSLKAKNRQYQSWFKSKQSKDIINIQEYYNFSPQKAKDVLGILTEDQLQFIADRLHKGGVVK